MSPDRTVTSATASTPQIAPLRDPIQQIRLLWLHGGGESDDVRLDTSVWYRENAPKYRAISYTWGLADVATVIVDGHTRSVRKNCAYALCQVRRSYPNSYIWLDSICIKQDDTAEKSAQVSGMHETYVQAQQILACVGNPDESSDYLFGLLSYLQDAYHDRDEWRREQSPEQSTALLHHLNRFAQRPYFGRVWVVQELYGGKGRTSVLCGWKEVQWDHLIELHTLLRDFHALAHQEGKMSAQFRVSQSIMRIEEIIQTGKTRSGINSLFAGPTLCIDPRDRVYGMLALIDWQKLGIPRPVPDYSIPCWRLALQAMRWEHPTGRASRETIENVAQALHLGDDLSSTVVGLLMEAEGAEHDTRRAHDFVFSRISRISINASRRLCTHLVPTEEEGLVDDWDISSDEDQSGSLLPFEGQEPLSIFTQTQTETAALVSPQTLPGDFLVQDDTLGCLVVRPGRETTCMVVGRAMIMPGYRMQSLLLEPSDECAHNIHEEGLQVQVKLSDRELLCLFAAQDRDRSGRDDGRRYSILPVPVSGTLVEDFKYLEHLNGVQCAAIMDDPRGDTDRVKRAVQISSRRSWRKLISLGFRR